MKRRKMRRYRTLKQNSGMKFLGFIGIIVGAVICGYLTARFLVGPLLGYDTEVLNLNLSSKLSSFIDKEDEGQNEQTIQQEQQDTQKETSKAESYRLQFGVFSTEAGAEELVQSLKQMQIETKVRLEDGNYKVQSETFASREEALEALEKLKKKQDIDVFITKS